MYITQSDIEDVYGEENVKVWSALGDDEVLDTGRIAKAIAWAEARVDNRLRNSRYTVPVTQGTSGYDKQLVNWCAVYAGHWLYSSRGIRRGVDDTDRTSAQLKQVEQEIGEVLAGQATLDAGDEHPDVATGPVVITGEPRLSAGRVGTFNCPINPYEAL